LGEGIQQWSRDPCGEHVEQVRTACAMVGGEGHGAKGDTREVT
jgi:hypothetical protein